MKIRQVFPPHLAIFPQFYGIYDNYGSQVMEGAGRFSSLNCRRTSPPSGAGSAAFVALQVNKTQHCRPCGKKGCNPYAKANSTIMQYEIPAIKAASRGSNFVRLF